MTCVWTPDPASLTDEWDALTPEVQEQALLLATSSLQMLTYYRVGTCPVTVRPCPEPRRCYCRPTTTCACRAASEITLPGPVGAVHALIIDGGIVAADAGWDRTGWEEFGWDPLYEMSDFRIDNGTILVWQGAGPSPLHAVAQDLSKPLTALGTWGIVYSQSYPVSREGEIAVARLALEYAKALGKSRSKCSLPKGVTNVVRNGVTFSIEAGLFPGGLTGDQVVDAFILQWAPAGAPTRNAVVFDPKRRSPRRSAPTSRFYGGSI